MTGTRWAGRILLTLAAATAIAGCGTVEEERRDDDDAKIARSALLTQQDVPAELVLSPSTTDEDDDYSDEELKRMCPGYPLEELRERGDATRSFESESLVMSHSVVLADDAAEASEQIADMPSRRSHRCMRNMVLDVTSDLEELGFARGRVTVEPLDVDAASHSAGLRLLVPLRGDGAELPDLDMDAHVVLTARDRGVSMVMMLAIGAPVDERLLDRLTVRAAEKLGAALDGE